MASKRAATMTSWNAAAAAAAITDNTVDFQSQRMLLGHHLRRAFDLHNGWRIPFARQSL